MLIKQFRASNNVRFFSDRMMRKFDLIPFTDYSEPVILYGMYKPEDYELLLKTKGTVVWCGSDALVLTEDKAKIILSNHHRHIAKSQQIFNSLKRWGIKSELINVTSTPLSIECNPRGDKVYCYVCSDNDVMYKKYKLSILKKLEHDLPYKFIYTTIRRYKPEELLKIYEQCFIGIRLLDHDGLSNSILEMGLMGRRTISNSGLPCTIPWGGYKGIREAVKQEFALRKKNNFDISEEMRKFITIDDQWREYVS